MRILFVAHAFPPTFGGVETHLWDLSRELARRGHAVHCLVGGERRDDAYDGIGVTRRPELEVTALQAARRGIARDVVRGELLERLRPIVAEALDAFRPDVVHMHNAHHFAPEPALALFEQRADGLINGVHDRVGDDLYPSVLALDWRHVLFASAYLRASMPRVRGRASVLLLGIDLSEFTHDGAADERMTALERPVVFHPARLLRWKGVEVGLEAFLALRRRLGRGSLVLCDSRNIVDDQHDVQALHASLAARAADAGMAHAVHFLDIHRRDIPAAYRAADLVWYPTTAHEPYGLVPLEAMACGVPLIVSDSGGMRETVVPGETGLVVPRRDAPALAAAAERLLRDRALAARLTAAGRRRAASFGIAAYTDALERVYAAA